MDDLDWVRHWRWLYPGGAAKEYGEKVRGLVKRLRTAEEQRDEAGKAALGGQQLVDQLREELAAKAASHDELQRMYDWRTRIIDELEESRDQAADKVRSLTAERYLGIACPICGRNRLLYSPATYDIRCEKCEADRDVLSDANPVEQVRQLREQAERLIEELIGGGWNE
jgi:ribosomal protein S27E